MRACVTAFSLTWLGGETDQWGARAVTRPRTTWWRQRLEVPRSMTSSPTHTWATRIKRAPAGYDSESRQERKSREILRPPKTEMANTDRFLTNNDKFGKNSKLETFLDIFSRHQFLSKNDEIFQNNCEAPEFYAKPIQGRLVITPSSFWGNWCYFHNFRVLGL